MTSARFVVCATVVLRLAAQSPVDPDADWRAAAEAALGRAVESAREDGFFGAVLVVRGGHVLLRRGFGTASTGGAPCAPETLFDVASVSKQFTVAAVLVLRARGKLSMHDPLERFFADVPEDKRAIRVEQLIAHESGLPANVIASGSELDDRALWLRRVWATPLDGAPGERFGYSNAGYGVLAAIVEVVAARRYEDFVRDAVLQPAGMHDTTFTGAVPPEDRRHARAAPRSGGPDDARFRDTALAWPRHWGFRGASGVVSTIDDLARWDRALRGDFVLPPDERRLLLEPRPRDDSGGLQSAFTAHGTVRQAHSGSVHGFESWFARYPDDDAFAVALGNERFVVSRMADGLEQALFAAGAPPSVVQSAVGRFTTGDGDRVELHAEGGRLHASCSGSRFAARASAGEAESERLGARRSVRARAVDRAVAAALRERALEVAVREIERRHGRIRASRFVGFGERDDEVWVELSVAGRSLTAVVDLDAADRVRSLEVVDRTPPSVELALDWRREAIFAATSRDGRERIELRVDGGGRRLLWRDRDGETLLERLR
ncbi:MAG: beta-lactamase family protein [Planctomycetes bacterium]|nr:beta-lactamase family protein [Planctomycetota bacterium]